MMLSNPTTAPLTSVNKRGIDDAIECSSCDVAPVGSSATTQETPSAPAEKLECCHDQPRGGPSCNETRYSYSSSGIQSGEFSSKVGDREEANAGTNNMKLESEVCQVKSSRTENGKIKNGDIKNETVKSADGVDRDKGGKEKDVIVLDDSLDDDFKQTKRRFRFAAATAEGGPVSYSFYHAYTCTRTQCIYMYMYVHDRECLSCVCACTPNTTLASIYLCLRASFTCVHRCSCEFARPNQT